MNKPGSHNHPALDVHLGSHHVGAIEQRPGGKNRFTFSDSYIEDQNRPTLSLSFQSSTGELNYQPRSFNPQVHPFFSNLLPEGRLREYLAELAGIKPVNEFLLLKTLGADLPGAITVTSPDDQNASEPSHSASMASHEPYDANNPNILRFSLAGVQLKFSAVMNTAGGLAIPAGGTGGHWIVKLPSYAYPSVPENEFTIMELARQIGIPVPELKLVPLTDIQGLPEQLLDHPYFEDAKALAVQRFDRTSSGGRIHIEDFNQVFGQFPDSKYSGYSYANIATALLDESGEQTIIDFLQRLTFSILTGNGDMHLKNWSLTYRDGITPELSPAYDMLSTLPYINDDQLALSFGGSKEITGITQGQVEKFAAATRASANQLQHVIMETTEQTLAAWHNFDVKELLPDTIRVPIDHQIKQVAASIKAP